MAAKTKFERMASPRLLLVLSTLVYSSSAQLSVPKESPATCAVETDTTDAEYFDVIKMRCEVCPVNTQMDSSGLLALEVDWS